MSEFDATQITLKYLANSIYQETMDKNKEQLNNLERKEIQFYKKRIYVFFKEMLKGKYPNDTLKVKHCDFVKCLIEHIKITDTSEIIQEHYNNFVPEKKIFNENIHEPTINNNLDVDKKMFNVENNNKNTLEDFVQIKKVKINAQEDLPYPKIKNINIKSENHRLKGVKCKSNVKNIKIKSNDDTNATNNTQSNEK